MVQRLELFWHWIHEGHAKILLYDFERDGAMSDRTGTVGPLEPNAFQKELFACWMKQALAGKPIRGVVLKPRKLGCTTIDEVFCSCMAQYFCDWTSRIVGHTDEGTEDVFEMVKRLFQHSTVGPRPNSIANPIRFTHGSQVDTRTAGGRYASTGATINALVLTELAKWPGTVAKMRSTIASMLNSMYDHPNTFQMIESTANMDDDTEVFENYWNAAGEKDSPFFRLFWPWYRHSVNTASAPDDFKLRDEMEDELHRKHDVSFDQLYWRRNKISALGSLSHFKQDYPSTPSEAFQRPQGRVFPAFDPDALGVRNTAEELIRGGYSFHGGIDFGSVGAWVGLVVAHKHGISRLTVDSGNCPNFCREMIGYRWHGDRRPRDRDNHTVDAFRYAVSHWRLTGHVHVFREYYNPDSAQKGNTLPYHADRVRDLLVDVPACMFACGRDQPGSTQYLNQNGVRAVSFRSALATVKGELLDGIDHINTLIGATGFLLRPVRTPTEAEKAADTARVLGLPHVTGGHKKPRRTRYAALRRF